MRQNMGLTDAYLRLFAGLLLLGMGVKSPSRVGSFFLLALGANKVAEGITRWCPVMSALQIDTLSGAERAAIAADRLGPRYGQLNHNPYRTYLGGELGEATNGDPPQRTAKTPSNGHTKQTRIGLGRADPDQATVAVGQHDGE